jgi:hypothetical protein
VFTKPEVTVGVGPNFMQQLTAAQRTFSHLTRCIRLL